MLATNSFFLILYLYNVMLFVIPRIQTIFGIHFFKGSDWQCHSKVWFRADYLGSRASCSTVHIQTMQAKRDSTPNELGPSRENKVMCGS